MVIEIVYTTHKYKILIIFYIYFYYLFFIFYYLLFEQLHNLFIIRCDLID
jgi:hypothetical protein